MPVDMRESLRCVHKRRGNRGGNQHHPHDRPTSEEQEVRDGPPWVLDRREHEQRDRRRSGEAMNDANDQRPDDLVQPETTQPPVEPGLWRLIVGMSVISRPVPVRVAMRVVAMAVHVRVESDSVHPARPEDALDPLNEAREVPHTEHDKHH